MILGTPKRRGYGFFEHSVSFYCFSCVTIATNHTPTDHETLKSHK